MQARFRSTCRKCQRDIHPGDNITRSDRLRAYVHVRCPDPEHIVQPAQLEFARRYRVDSHYVQYVAELIMEAGGSEHDAWLMNCQHNEHWDGEDAFREAAWYKWTAAIPLARAQNALIHGGR